MLFAALNRHLCENIESVRHRILVKSLITASTELLLYDLDHVSFLNETDFTQQCTV